MRQRSTSEYLGVDTSHCEGEPKSMTFAMEYVRFTARTL
jgi:hypothetical protein